MVLATVLLSCQNNTSTSTSSTKDTIAKTDTQSVESNAEAANTWLKAAIIKYFKTEENQMAEITTPEYYEFKMDAINVDLEIDSVLTQSEFEQKWKDKFDLKTHQINIGFLISGQDWGNIQVEKSELIEENKDAKTYLFHVIIKDLDFKDTYDRDIKVVDKDGKFLIADVIERN